MADTIETDLAVLGGGPGGYAAAFLAADKGLRVVLIDAGAKPGGTCLHVGCIPSKTLLHAARLITDARDAAHFGIHFEKPKIDVAQLRAQGHKIVDTLATNLLELCKKRKVQYIAGRGRFESSSELQVEGGPRIRFKHGIVATGSSPARIPTLSLDDSRIMDSTAALRLDDAPNSLLVVGGGYIGLELGTVYAALGTRVTVVELTDGLLPGVDRDLVRPLQARLAGQFEKIYLGTKVLKLEPTAKGIKAVLEGEEVAEKEPMFDRVLVAVGRKPNSAGLGLEKTKATLDEKGFVRVDDQRRTQDPRIFAIGDVAGEPMLAHKAAHEGKVAVETILGEPALCDWRAMPAVVFTDPEIAWCGLTESEARRQKREVKAARFPWAASGRAMTLARTDGLTKLLVDPTSDQVLGVGIVGVGAGELIGEAVLAIETGTTARDLAMIVHPHPTLSESAGEAAEMLFGTATHLLRPARK